MVEMHVAHANAEPAAAVAGVVLVLIMVLFGLAYTVAKAIVFWRIFAKTGYSGALGLLMLIPVVDVVMALVLAFGKWPIERELEHVRQFHNQP